MSKTRLFVLVSVLILVAAGAAVFLWQQQRSKKAIEFVAVGQIDSALVEEIAKGTAEVYGVAYRILPQAVPLTEAAYNPLRKQYHAYQLVWAAAGARQDRDHRILGLADADFYLPRTYFVFGSWERSQKAATLSVARLRPEFYPGGTPDRVLLVRRAVTESVHELAHLSGLEHCPNAHCVMYYSDSIMATDLKGMQFCEDCAGKLRELTNR